jgi:1-deoxy-D-xylulose-5-phosphate reductoisomerase
LVVAGELVTRLIAEHNVSLIPVDSEHSAIFQCLVGENPDHVEKIYITASGGPFLNKSPEELKNVTLRDALNHPTWNMGKKITIDSATLINKGFEVMEARWLFGLRCEQIEVVVHPQSIIHSIVQFHDGSMKAQMSLPDMRLPIQYALVFPERLETKFTRLSFRDIRNLTFEPPDLKKFRNLALAFEVMNNGGNQPCILNAANEVAVTGFLKNKIGFTEIPQIIENCLHSVYFIQHPTLQDYFETDFETRKLAQSLIGV